MKYLLANRIFMSSLLCLVFLWPIGTGHWGGVNCNYEIPLWGRE